MENKKLLLLNLTFETSWKKKKQISGGMEWIKKIINFVVKI